MNRHINKIEIIHCEDSFLLSFEETINSFGVSKEIIIEIIDEGIISQESEDYNQWQFTHIDIAKIRTVLQLEQDLGVNIAGAALALELMKKINAN